MYFPGAGRVLPTIDGDPFSPRLPRLSHSRLAQDCASLGNPRPRPLGALRPLRPSSGVPSVMRCWCCPEGWREERDNLRPAG
jgi:hypothetical protein